MWSLDLRRVASTSFCWRTELARRSVFSVWVGGCLGWAVTATQSHAQTLPSSRVEIADDERLSWTLKKIPSQQYMNEIYWNHPSDTPAFFRDLVLQFVARSYYLTCTILTERNQRLGGVGAGLAFRSGLIGDMFGVHAAYYTSQPLFAPADESGTKLSNPGQNPLGMLGQIYGRVQVSDQEFRGGRQLVDTPLINPQDNRMVPNTFEGTTVVTLPDKDRNYDYAVGYLWSVKQRDLNDFISMSDALASGDVGNRGATFGMVKYRPFSGFSTIFMDYYVQDFVNAGFAQAEYNFQRPKEVPNWIVGANVIAQQSVGSDLLTGSSFQTYQTSAKLTMKHAGWALFVAGSITGDGFQIFSPFAPSRPTPTCSRCRSTTLAKKPLAERRVRFRIRIQQGWLFRSECRGLVYAWLGCD